MEKWKLRTIWWMRGVVLLGWGLFFVAIVVEIATFRFPSKMLYFGCFVLAALQVIACRRFDIGKPKPEFKFSAGRDDCGGDPVLGTLCTLRWGDL
jgi:hypothetical protein